MPFQELYLPGLNFQIVGDIPSVVSAAKLAAFDPPIILRCNTSAVPEQYRPGLKVGLNIEAVDGQFSSKGAHEFMIGRFRTDIACQDKNYTYFVFGPPKSNYWLAFKPSTVDMKFQFRIELYSENREAFKFWIYKFAELTTRDIEHREVEDHRYATERGGEGKFIP